MTTSRDSHSPFNHRMPWWLIDFDLADYQTVYALQRQALPLIKEKRLPNCILIGEHPSVVTVGRGQAGLPKTELQIIPVERGGESTYHAPGQLIVYPLLTLSPSEPGRSLKNLIWQLEAWCIETLEKEDLSAYRHPTQPGIWTGEGVPERKVASLGLAIKNWISYHGLALNICNKLEPFHSIQPCGLNGKLMTSIQVEKPDKKISFSSIKQSFLEHLHASWEPPSRQLSQNEFIRAMNHVSLGYAEN